MIVYEVLVSTNQNMDGAPLRSIGFADNRSTADYHAAGKGFYGSPGTVVEVEIIRTASGWGRVVPVTDERLLSARDTAVAKLTDEDKRILGIS